MKTPNDKHASRVLRAESISPCCCCYGGASLPRLRRPWGPDGRGAPRHTSSLKLAAAMPNCSTAKDVEHHMFEHQHIDAAGKASPGAAAAAATSHVKLLLLLVLCR